MELTVNLFSKGLQIDTHPMVLDNNTLSDALNATFVTMNGNEVILQNDMGNRRIDNAFLPAGYQPLGMKEYGGVIYVAAYNPLTNRGLIGSFPSPQRKVNINKDKGGFLDFNSFINTDIDDDNRKFGYIGLEYIIIPLSDRIVLHTGDKFSIYSSQISEFLLYLLPDDIDKRKNNLFTFQVGVFNSLNEFVDITNKLKIWGNGYFINTESNIPNETIADNDLLKARNKLAINTYSQKMSSPLYLKAIINHISNLSYSIVEAEFIDNTKAELTIEVTYQYNCPDNIDGEVFQMLFNDKKTIIDKSEDPIYLEEFNLYSKKIVYKTIIKDFNNDPNSTKYKNKYNYELKFPLLHNFEEWNYPIYIKELNKKGTIDLSKIGSDTIIFKGYRYFNNTSTKMTTLEVNLESYPKKESKIYVEIKAIAHDVSSHVNDGSTKNIGKIEKPGVGIFTLTFPYETFGERELYLLSFTKKDENNSNIEESLDKYISVNPNKPKNHFFITTGIFNGNYIGKKFLSEEDKNQFYQDGKLIYSYDYIKDIYIEDFSEILKLDLTPILKYNISNDTTESKLEVTGNYIFPVNYDVNEKTYKINETWDIINTLDLYIEVNNQEVYPKEVDNALGVGVGNKKLHINNIINRTINDELMSKRGSFYYYGDKDLYEYTNYRLGDDEHIITITEESNPISTSTNLLKILLKSSVSVNNILKGRLIEKTIFCEHVITSYWDFIRKHYYGTTLDRVLIKNPYFCVDYEGLNLVTVTYTEELTHVNDLKDLNEGHPRTLNLNGKKSNNSYIEEIARDHISDFINEKSNGNLFAIEISTDDCVMGYLPCVWDYQNNTFNGLILSNLIINSNFNSTELLPNGPGICGNFYSFRRIWLKINKLEYVPILITRNLDNLGLSLGLSNDVTTYMYDDNRLHNLLQHIPHYYEYESGGKTLPEKVFNNTNYSRTKEFEVNSNIKLNILGEAILLNDSIFSLKHPKISENITFKEGIIHSNLDFEEDLENIKNYRISCVIMDGDYDNHTLYIKDCNGKYFDPLYIYYNDNECFSYSKLFRASYIPEKFYVEELGLYMPELKSSRKLYSGKNGENTLINEYVYPYESARNLFKLLKGFYYYDTTNNNREFDEYDITSKQYEGGNSDTNSSRFLPLRTKNIFDRTYILGYGLTSENISNNIERLKLD